MRRQCGKYIESFRDNNNNKKKRNTVDVFIQFK